MKTRILFVDDEPGILDGLRRLLRSYRNEWEMSFASSGQEALAIVAEQSIDAVVTDMRMPGMDGSQLLNELARCHPGIVRFVLSGYSDDEMIIKSVGTAHQYLSKPCDSDLLKAALSRALSLRKLLHEERLLALVSGVSSLPSLPEVYLEILETLRSDGASLRKVGETISRDPAITAKVLQLVNSAFFGLGRKISNPADAASLLGLDVLKTLALSAGVFSQFDQNKISTSDFSLAQVFDHCIAVGLLGKRIAASEEAESNLVSECLLAGTLHDLGKLIIVNEYPEEYARMRLMAKGEGMSEYLAEKEILGATHAEVAAYLLGLWGFTDSVVEAVAYHHQPGLSSYAEFTPLTAVHVANALEGAAQANERTAPCAGLDMSYLEASGLADRLESWGRLRESAGDSRK